MALGETIQISGALAKAGAAVVTASGTGISTKVIPGTKVVTSGVASRAGEAVASATGTVTFFIAASRTSPRDVLRLLGNQHNFLWSTNVLRHSF